MQEYRVNGRGVCQKGRSGIRRQIILGFFDSKLPESLKLSGSWKKMFLRAKL